MRFLWSDSTDYFAEPGNRHRSNFSLSASVLEQYVEDMKQFNCIKTSVEGTTLIATLSRPEAMNALNAELIADLEALVQDLMGSSSVRAVVLTGQGEKAFVAGADIKQFEAMTPAGAEAFAERGQSLFAKLALLPQPVIAAVNGFALGGGLELALACDFIFASDNAKFSLPECTLGLIPGFGGTVRLPRRVGTAKALEMALTGAMIGADEALRIGLVNKVVPQADLMKAVLEQAALIGGRAPKAIEYIKKSIHGGQERSLEEADGIEAKLFGRVFATEDKVEGVRAFIEKRKPQFKGC